MNSNLELDMDNLLNTFNSVRISKYSIGEDYIEETQREAYMERLFNPENLHPFKFIDEPNQQKEIEKFEDDEDDHGYISDDENEQTLEHYYAETYNSDLEC